MMEVVLLLVILLPVGWCSDVDFEAESGVYNGQLMIRTSASDWLTVWLHEGENVSFIYNVPRDKSCQIKVTQVVWSNDGFDDVIDIYIDGIYTSGIATLSNSGEGHHWNSFFISEPSGSYTTLMYGRHSIMLYATTTDDYGAEVDRIRLESNCQSTAEGLSIGGVVGITIASTLAICVCVGLCVSLCVGLCVFKCMYNRMQKQRPIEGNREDDLLLSSNRRP